MKAPGALRTNAGDLLVKSTMSLEAEAMETGQLSFVRIVLADTLPGGSAMEVTLDPEKAAGFAVALSAAAEVASAARMPLAGGVRADG